MANVILLLVFLIKDTTSAFYFGVARQTTTDAYLSLNVRKIFLVLSFDKIIPKEDPSISNPVLTILNLYLAYSSNY